MIQVFLPKGGFDPVPIALRARGYKGYKEIKSDGRALLSKRYENREMAHSFF